MDGGGALGVGVVDGGGTLGVGVVDGGGALGVGVVDGGGALGVGVVDGGGTLGVVIVDIVVAVYKYMYMIKFHHNKLYIKNINISLQISLYNYVKEVYFV